jgi:hypothetical protein
VKSLFAGKYRLVDRFFLLTAELAFKKHQAAALGEVEENRPVIEQMRAELRQMSTQMPGG